MRSFLGFQPPARSSTKRFHRLLGLVILLAASAGLAQTPVPAARQGYIYPGDSIACEITLDKGDVLNWALTLAAAPLDAGSTMLTIESSVEGVVAHRELKGEPADLRDEVHISRAATYRVKVKNTGTQGRVANLSVWPTLARSSEIPFPLHSVQRQSQVFAAGDKVAVTIEFVLSDKLAFEDLLGLTLPLNLISVWGTTSLGDSLASTASVRRWVGNSDRLTLRERTPRGGRISLRLEVDIPIDGEVTLLIAPGVAPPDWLPPRARMVTERWHHPWSAVVVPPAASVAESLAARGPGSPKALYIAQSLRSRGVDALTVARFFGIWSERDSLSSLRQARVLQSQPYDTAFLIGASAFVPPDLHVALMFPLAGDQRSGPRRREMAFTYRVENNSGGETGAQLYEWRYDEARIALAGLPDEPFWDGAVLPLKREVQVHKLKLPSELATLTHPAAGAPRPASFEREGISCVDRSQQVWGFYLVNPSSRPLTLIYHTAYPLHRPMAASFKRVPKLAWYAIGILAVLALIALAAWVRARWRELERRHRAEELAADLEKARQVQLKLLPSGPLTIEGVEVYGLHQSMQLVGGDYYDFFQLEDGRVILCVADVTGHGMPAALLMSNTQATLRALVQSGKPTNDIIALLNTEIFQRTSPENFVTMILAEISRDRTTITYCNAGHNPGYVVRSHGDPEELDAGGIMLGALDLFPFVSMEVKVRRGDLIALYTDGIPESEIGHEDMFGYERLKYFLSQNCLRPLPDIARDLFKMVTPPPPQVIADDMALVLVRVK